MIILFISVAFMQACFLSTPDKHDFYSDLYEESDVFRFPVLKPFDLVSIDTFKWSGGKEFGRQFGLHQAFDSINYQTKYITIYISTSSESGWAIIDIYNSKQYTKLSYEEFCVKTKEYGISNELHDIKKSYKIWKASKKLPWKID